MSMRKRLLPPAHEPTRPDVSFAIVNIVLLLILFFLATGALVNTPDQGVDISETRDLEIDQLPPPVLLIRPDRSLSLDGIDITPEGLVQTLQGQSVVHVLIDRSAPALDLLQILAQPGMDQFDIRLVTVHRRDPT
jgi:biopolymer transport protein ExbD